MSDRDRIEFQGRVVESSNGFFKVEVNEGHVVSCTLSGKIRKNSVRILLNDWVTIEVSPYETSKGRIIFRHK